MFIEPGPVCGITSVDAKAIQVNYGFHVRTFLRRMKDALFEGFADGEN
jgi:hypothetical protein